MKEIDPFKNTITELYKSKEISLEILEKAKRKTAKAFSITTPGNSDLLKAYHNLVSNKRIKPKPQIEAILRKRKIRSLSGIVIVSVLTKPYACPGDCLYCPTQAGIPKSYLSNEPAVMRAVLNKFDPYMQVKNRLQALKNNGHPIDKADLRVIGGTWSYYSLPYQYWFILRCFEAANNFGKKQDLNSLTKISSVKNLKALLEKEQKKNEKAKTRIIGITIETRPDYINEKEIKQLREYGVTRVELGVQSIYDDVLKLNNRGHLVDKTISATKLLKDGGIKICFQMMPNLPGATLARDKKMFRELFDNPVFKPDMLKIYPCAILKEAKLYNYWKSGKYKPYTEKQLFSLIKSIKQSVPYYTRIQRIIRDIPAESIAAGPAKVSNMRQQLFFDMAREGWKCNCIRCREVGENYNPKEKLKLFREDYNSSDGKEIFLSIEDLNREKIYSLLRLRIPSQIFENKTHFLDELESCAIIREVHTYGQLHSFIGANKKAAQHKGMGKKLIQEAEKIACTEFKLKKIGVISGIGVKGYYKKLGYKAVGTYLVKQI